MMHDLTNSLCMKHLELTKISDNSIKSWHDTMPIYHSVGFTL